MTKIISVFASLAIFATVNLSAKDVYGEVNGQKIDKTDIAMYLKNPNVDFDQLPQNTQTDILNRMTEKIIMMQEALKSDVVNSAEFKKSLEKVKGDLALEFWMQDVAKKITVSDKEADDFFAANKDKFASLTKYKARHILVKTEDEAKKIIAELKKSKKAFDDFIKIAKDKTQDPSGKTSGGDLGWFELGKMVPEFSNATKELKTGAFSQTPVKSDFGYHVIYLEDKKDIEKNQVKQIVLQNKFNEKIKELLTEFKKSAKIKIEN